MTSISINRLFHVIGVFGVLLSYQSQAALADNLALENIHHNMHVELAPDSHTIAVENRIQLPRHAHNVVRAQLNADLTLSSTDTNVTSIEKLKHKDNNTPVEGVAPVNDYLITLIDANKPFTLTYHGVIHHQPTQSEKEYARSMSETTGIIDEQGIFLARTSRWYPQFSENEMVTFDMSVRLPKAWKAITQGTRTLINSTDESQTSSIAISQWVEDNPQDDIYLIAAPFTEYSQQTGRIQAMVFLRNKDDALAQKYLDATGQYIAMYNQLLGPYPYDKFALVENFWETGYGMPSFTLLGSKVIHFPFIIVSSYPHEILHNWWGNGVYVDYQTGNWSEGLTAYLADHLLKEQRGEGAQYRRGLLQKYTDYVDGGEDFPLSQFRSRHNAETEAVGYGKTAMLFHMLRIRLGDDLFVKSLREFYKQYKFKIARFDDLQRIFSEQSQQNLAPFFDQWVKRTGAPTLKIDDIKTIKIGDAYEMSLTIKQLQKDSFSLLLPITVWMEGQKKVFESTVQLNDQHQIFKLKLPAKPWKVDVDPQFDVFRRLDSREIPSALSQGFGADKPLLILPSKTSKKHRKAYAALAQQWKTSQSGNFEIVTDKDIKKIPGDREVWIIGWENKFRNVMNKSITGEKVTVSDKGLTIGKQTFSKSKHAVVVTGRNSSSVEHTLLWIAADNIKAIAGLARKLPHYGKYSYLAFTGDEPTNMAKGQWEISQSPMSVLLVDSAMVVSKVVDSEPIEGHNKGVKLSPRPALIDLPPIFSKQRMMEDIQFLANEKMKGRELGSVELDKAADYIAGQFKVAGLRPAGENTSSYFQEWTEDVGGDKGNIRLKNVVAVLPGNNPKLVGESVIVSAHYDHLGLGWPDVHEGDKGKIHYGADDNASGVAVMLELARQVANKWKPERAIVFVAFTGEEAGLRGSAHYIKSMTTFPAKKITAVLNLDTVGRLGKEPLKIFGVGSASELVHVFQGAGYVTGVNIKPVMTDFGSGDQKSFLDRGIPAVQFFSSAHNDFHRPTDTVDKIDADGLIKVAMVLKEGAEYLANRVEPLTVTLINKAKNDSGEINATTSSSKRKVRLGTIPDFTYEGKGVKISGTTPDTPAHAAGLISGDIITAINSKPINNLAGLADVLRGLKAQQQVELVYLRAGKEYTVKLNVESR